MGMLFNRAIQYAVDAHANQLRKGTNIPYIVHPMEAAAIAATMTQDEEILAAAVLHDVIEDTNRTRQDIEREFGETVAAYVASESENKRENLPAAETWQLRKQETLDRLSNASEPIQMIALGDKLSNLRAINHDFTMLGDQFWQRFTVSDPSMQAWYYLSMVKSLENLNKYPAYQEFAELAQKVFGRFKA